VVDAPAETRIARVMARDGVPREAVEARMRHQAPAGALRDRADYLIENAGDQAALRRRVREVFDEVTGHQRG
jgi:dephospho-CoA kinase